MDYLIGKRARMAEVKAHLAAGTNPYTKLATLIIGGKAPRDEVQPVDHPPLKRDMVRRVVSHTTPIAGDMRRDMVATAPNPDMLECSFCGAGCHRSRITFGKGPLQKSRKLEQEIDAFGQSFVVERIIHYTNKVQACPNCCLQVKQTVFLDTRG